MLVFDNNARIYLKPGVTDMRKSINTLVPIVQQEMKLDPFEAGYFVFCNKTRHLLKILYWDKTGFALWYKRLEKNKYPWPNTSEEVRKLDSTQIDWLLSGIDFFRSHQRLDYSVGF